MAQILRGVVDTQKPSYKSIGQVNVGDSLNLELDLTMDNQALTLINPIFELIVKKADGKKVRQLKDIVYSAGKVKIIADEQITASNKNGIVTSQLFIKDEGRISTCLFYFNLGSSLDNEIIQSIDKVEVLEQLDEYVVQAFENLKEFEKRILDGETTIRKLNDDMTAAENIRNDNEISRVSAESERSSNEEARVITEDKRKLAESDREIEETERAEAESIRKNNEDNRQFAESNRITKENHRELEELQRQSNESYRIDNEEIRQSNETERELKESARKLAEVNRESAETNRVNKESQRINNENTRINDETIRKNQEQIRHSNEEARIEAEIARASVEQTRTIAESSRVSAESARVNAEFARVTNETARIEAETNRVNAENSRVITEQGRKAKFGEMELEYQKSAGEVVENRKGYDGTVYANMYEARKADYETLDNKFGDFTHSKFTGIGNFKADNTKEGLVKEINVKGRTLQNLLPEFNSTYAVTSDPTAVSISYSNKSVTMISDSTWNEFRFMYSNLLKDNTKYTVILNVTENTLNSGSRLRISRLVNTGVDSYIDIVGTGCKMSSFTTNSSLASSWADNQFWIGISPDAKSGSITIKDIVLLEGDHTNIPLSALPYIESIQSAGETDIENGKNVIEVKSCVESMFNGTLELGGIAINDGSNIVSTTIVRTKTFISVKPNTNYCLISKVKTGIAIRFYDENNVYISGLISTVPPVYFTTPINCYNIKFAQVDNNNTSTIFQLHETIKEFSIKYLLDEPLRSLPNGVRDEIVGDKLIKRVGKVVLNGSESGWTMNDVVVDPNIHSKFVLKKSDVKLNSTTICNRFKTLVYLNSSQLNDEYVMCHSASNEIGMCIKKSRLNTQDITGFKTWLSSNNVTVYYELATPIITDIGIKTLKGYDGVTNIFMNNSLVSEISAKVPMDITSEIEANRKDFNGNLYPSMYEARKNETAYLLDKINNAEYLEKTGCNITATNSYDGLTKDLSVKGRTLQNLYGKSFLETTNIVGILNGEVDADGYVTLVGDGNFKNANIKCSLLKPNTDYTLIIVVKENTIDSNGSVCVNVSSNDYSPFTQTATIFSGESGVRVFKVTTKSDLSITYGLKLYVRNTTTSGKFIFKPYILEGDYSNTPLSELPYIEGIKSTGEADIVEGKYPISVKSCRKNLFDSKNLQVQSDNFVKTTVGVKHVLSFNCVTNGRMGVYITDVNKNRIATKAFTTGKNSIEFTPTTRVTIFYIATWDSGATLSSITDIQIEEGTIPTPYEPYREISIKYLLDEPLRSLPSGVADEIKGNQLIRRVGKVVLDGSSDEEIYKIEYNYDKVIRYDIKMPVNYKENSVTVVPNIHVNIFPKYFSPMPSNTEGFLGLDNKLVLFILKSRLNSESVTELKSWLSNNNIIVYYELVTPIITTLDQKLVLNTYDATTHITSDNYLLPKITAKVPSNVQAVVTNLMSENKSLSNELESTKQELETNVNTLNDMDTELIATTWDMDYRVCEIEWTLEDISGATPMTLKIGNTLRGGTSNMALSRYEQAKIMILGGKYDKETLTKQLTTYLNRGYVTQEEYDELIALMEARELVEESK